MKMNNYLPKKRQGYVSTGLVLLFFAFLFSSCLKSKNNDYVPTYSSITVVNASPELQSGIYFQSYAGSDPTPILYSGSKMYKNLVSGYPFVLVPVSNTNKVLAGGDVFIDEYVSVYITGEYNESAKDSSFAIVDKFITPSTGNAAIRFVQATKSAGEVDVALEFNTTTEDLTAVKYSGTANNPSPEFKNYPAEETTITVYAAGTDTELATYSFTPAAGKSYSVFLHGKKETTDEAKQLKIGVVNHTDLLAN